MNWVLHFLEAEGSLAAWRQRLEEEAAMLHGQLVRLLAPDVAVPRLDILVQRLPGQVIPELGMGGHSYRRSLMSITLDPDAHTFAACLEAGQFRRMVTHELHHCLRYAAAGYGRTLGDALVSEGLADHFEAEVHGADAQPWTHAIADTRWPAVLAEAEPQLAAEDYDHVGWFYGRLAHADRIPRWAGYTIGYRLVGAYLARNPAARPSRLAGIRSNEILAEAWPMLRSAL